MNDPLSQFDHHQEADFARQVLRAEADAVGAVAIGPSFHAAAELIEKTTGSLVISGLGKNSYIGQKISATFSSLGTPSHFMHPTEAMHGDLGRIRANDVTMLLSFGGSTEEVVTLATLLKQDNVDVIAITGSEGNDLARLATVSLAVGPLSEACPHNLAPTASTTAMLALGDALALAVSKRKNFGVDDFRRTHPGGSLGRQLAPVMQAIRFKVGENLPLIEATLSIQDAYGRAESNAAASGLRRAGALLIVDDDGKLAGIFTDGDLRRSLIHDGSSAWSAPIGSLMTKAPRSLRSDALVRDAVQMVREYRIDEIPVVDDANHPVGLVDVQDLMSLKVIEG